MLGRRAALALAALTGCSAAEPSSPLLAPLRRPEVPPAPGPRAPVPRAPGQSALRKAIDRSAAHLARACTASGAFVYRINLDPRVAVGESYNVLRHAGAIYALADYQRRWPDPEVAAAIARALGHLGSFAAPVPGHPELTAIWSHDDPDEAKLGGAGLGLVALESVPERGDLDLSRRLARFIAFMQRDDGSFYSKLFARVGPDDRFVSLYYPGEAALGMLLLHERDPDAGWGRIALRALSFLATSRRARRRVPPDHWALLAAARGLGESPALFTTPEREQVIAHSRQVVTSILAARPHHDARAIRHGSFTPDGRTTPTATRLEGLLAALGHVEDRELEREMIPVIDAGIAFLERALVRDGAHSGAMPRAIERLAEEPPDSAFNRRATEVRIDYVQHALSAFLAQHDRLHG